MLMAGADLYDWVFTRVLGLAGHPAATATLLAAAWALAVGELPTVVVVVDEEDGLGPFELVRNTMRMTLPAMNATMMALRICLRRFFAFASWASRSSRAARWRALLSLGTARDPIFPARGCRIRRNRSFQAGGGDLPPSSYWREMRGRRDLAKGQIRNASFAQLIPRPN